MFLYRDVITPYVCVCVHVKMWPLYISCIGNYTNSQFQTPQIIIQQPHANQLGQVLQTQDGQAVVYQVVGGGNTESTPGVS